MNFELIASLIFGPILISIVILSKPFTQESANVELPYSEERLGFFIKTGMTQ